VLDIARNASDKEVRFSAELPGMDEKDIEVLVDNDVLTIRGEKKSESEDQGRRLSERYYGRFERSIALPFEVDEEKAEASFKNGVLTVTIPNPTVRRQCEGRASSSHYNHGTTHGHLILLLQGVSVR
jgi:HSP20 family protein